MNQKLEIALAYLLIFVTIFSMFGAAVILLADFYSAI